MIDEAIFISKAGDGGDGKVSFHREKYVPKGGPDGGDGGKGGSIYLQADPHLNTLRFFASKNRFTAENGQPGGQAKKHGKDGKDMILKVPIGTVIYDANSQKIIADLGQPNKRLCIACGGKGGKGNWRFRSSTNTTPRQAEPGEKGEQKKILLKLKLLAQVGLVGLPNAGKSTLLSVLTKAKPKIANYPFTTLSPNLGVVETENNQSGLIIADIPGLIEGASKGKGLGTRFLKHIERCKLLVYVLYPEDENLELKSCQLAQKIWEQKQKVKKELKIFNPKLLKVPNITVINKKDLLSKKQEKAIQSFFQSEKKPIIIISAATKENIKILISRLKSFRLLKNRED